MVKIEVITDVKLEENNLLLKPGKQGYSHEQFFKDIPFPEIVPVYFPENIKWGFWFPNYLNKKDVKIIGQTL